MSAADAMTNRIDQMAADLGRLRRHVGTDPLGNYPALLVDRLAFHLQAIDAQVQPTAAELYRCYVYAGLPDTFAVDRALELVDQRDQHLPRLIGEARR
jgi:hypothetical protein